MQNLREISFCTGHRYRGYAQRSLSTSGGNSLHRFNLAMAHQQSVVKIVHRGTNMARQQVKNFADSGPLAGGSDGQGQMLFTWRARNQFRMAKDYTGRHSRVGGHGLMAGVAGHDSLARPAYHAR